VASMAELVAHLREWRTPGWVLPPDDGKPVTEVTWANKRGGTGSITVDGDVYVMKAQRPGVRKMTDTRKVHGAAINWVMLRGDR
jgi:hypothetical protein